MSKIRVHEYAKQQKVQSKEILNVLKKLEIPVTNHMSTIDEEIIKKIEDYFAALKEGTLVKKQPAKKAAKEVTTQKVKEKQVVVDNEKLVKKQQVAKKPKDGQDVTTAAKESTRKESVKKPITKEPVVILYTGALTVGELASTLKVDATEIIKKLMDLGIMATINQELDLDSIILIAAEYGAEVEEKIEIDDKQFELFDTEDAPEDLLERAPVVTIMGHVDHGKTTLLDAIRKSKITAGEAGGITQHIGAYQVDVKGKKITFLDTPGHEAFTTMRARGAKVTDITILVVAADDGVMPQTIEAVNHAKAAEVPIIVAVNKMDKPTANIDRIKQELADLGLLAEDWGGETIFVPISALKREGLDDLLEMLLLVSEVEEFKANPNRLAAGTVIESQLDKGRGVVATILIQNGTLEVGDPLVVGVTFGRVRAMVNDRGKRIKSAGPSTPVEITGLSDVPQAGDLFIAFAEERKARAISDKRSARARESELRTTARVTLDDLFKQIQEGEIRDLNIIIKGDVQGSVEALQESLLKIDVEGVKIKVIHKGVGAITETDVSLASASNAIIIGFNVRPEPQAREAAELEKVDIRLHQVIYKVIEEINAAMQGLLDPKFEEVIIGRAEVRQVFKASNIGTIAGCFVTDGKITRNAQARVIRDNKIVYDSTIESLKRFKEDVREVAKGYECGITVTKYNDIKENDVIEAYIMEEVKI